MKQLGVRVIGERLSLVKTVRQQVAKAVASVRRKAKKTGTQVDIIFRTGSPTAPNSAYAAFRNRLRKLGLWDAARDQLARERFNQMYTAEDRQRQRAAAHPDQPLFPGFNDLPVLRIAQSVGCGD